MCVRLHVRMYGKDGVKLLVGAQKYDKDAPLFCFLNIAVVLLS